MSSNGHDTSMRAALATAEAAASRPSPADRFNIDREGPAKRAGKLRALQQRFQKLNEYCDETVAEIRASLERSPLRQPARNRCRIFREPNRAGVCGRSR